MTYWVSRGKPSDAERELTTFVGGTSIESTGADEFFGDLLEKVEALAAYGGDDPLSAPVAAATVKRYLDTPERYVRLRELVSSIGRDTRESLFGDGRFDLQWRPGTRDGKDQNLEYSNEFRRRVLAYEKRCEIALAIMAAGGHYAGEQQARAFGELLELAASPPLPNTPRQDIWWRLERYSALRLLYAGGVSAVAADNWTVLRTLLREARFQDFTETVHPLVFEVNPWAVQMIDDTRHASVIRLALGAGVFLNEPIAEWLFKTLRDPLREYAPLDFGYEQAFHKFETLIALVYVDIKKRSGDERRRNWAPLGRFAAQHGEFPTRSSTFSMLFEEYKAERRKWPPITSGLLEDPAPVSGGTPKIDTVEHNFEVVEGMISNQGYD